MIRTVLARRVSAPVLALALALNAGQAVAQGQDRPKLPSALSWSTNDIGTPGYLDASVIAETVQAENKVRIRLVPSATAIGRLLPMTSGRVTYGFLANEAYFATEAQYDFASLQWGPQDLRIVLAKPASAGLAVPRDANIKSASDLRGKRIGYVKGNPGTNIKNDAYLAFGGLAQKDVQVVWFGSYNAMKPAILAGQLDAMNSATNAPGLSELEQSPRGLAWVPLPADDREGWNRMKKVASFFEPYAETTGVGIAADNPVTLIGYRSPMLATYSRRNADEVYSLVKAIDEAYPEFKDRVDTGALWEVTRSGKPPADAPWHEGTIRYMKEKGLWQPQDQAWQDARLARLQRVMSVWDDAVERFYVQRVEQEKKGAKPNVDEAWDKFWEEYRAKHLDTEG